jgi:hypothetical protein
MGRSIHPARVAPWRWQTGHGRGLPAWLRRLALVAATLVLTPTGRAAAQKAPAPALAPLGDSEAATLAELPEEKPYDVRLHFLRSNERRHDVFFSALRNLGGGYIGVGADQNYTLAAVAHAELLWLIDIDGDVVQWHRIYAALIPLAATPGDLIALLARGSDAQIKAALAERWPADEAKRLWPTFRRYRGLLAAHLRAEQQVRLRGRPVTWVADPALYAYIRGLMQARRVIARVGDLHGETTILAIGAAARRLGFVVRTVYLSNVEQWFRYSPQFRRNLASLPRDGKTIVLRTLARGELPAPEQDRWHFSVQTLDDFLFRMEEAKPPAREVLNLMPEMARSRQPGLHGLSWLGSVQAMPRPAAEWALLPPLREGAPASTEAARPAPETLPPLRLLMPAPVAVSPLPAGPPGSPSAAPPSAPSALLPWSRLPPLREAPPVLLHPVAWPLLPALRGGEAASTAPSSAPDSLPRPPAVADKTPPVAGRRVPWDSLPTLRDAHAVPRRVPQWRILPPLRDR